MDGLEVMNSVNYYSPVVVVGITIAAAIHDVCKVHKSKTMSALSKRRILFAYLSATITVTYLVRAAEQVRYLTADSESGFVHALSQTLLWTTISLAMISSPSMPSLPYLTAWLLSFCVETSICAFAYAVSRRQNISLATDLQLALQLTTSALMLVLSSWGIVTLYADSRIELNDETQSLLRDGPAATSYATTETNSDDGSSPEDASEESDPDEKEVIALREQKLQQIGSWTAYLATFKVFLPFVFPTNNLRLQIYVVIVLVNTLLQRFLNVLHPYQLGVIIDKLSTSRQIPWFNVSLWIGLELLASSGCGLPSINDLLQERLAAWSRQQIDIAAFDKVMSLSMSFHDSKESGEIIRAIEQAGSLGSLFRVLITDIVPGFIDILIAMWYVSHLLDIYATLLLVAVMIAFLFTTIHISTYTARARRETSATEREASKVLYETVANWSIVSYFSRKQFETLRLAKILQAVAKAQVMCNDVYVVLFGINQLSEQIGRYAVSILAMYKISNGTSSVGNFVTLQSYWNVITMPLYNLGWSYRTVSTDMINAERLMQLFETEISVKDKPNAHKIDVNKGGVIFDNVKFAYEGRSETLASLNFEAKPGQTIALVGETGSGKSTIFKLLMRFYDISSGKVTIDGQDITDVTIDSLRDVFGFVPQDSVLFNTTILDNVRYGRLEATDEEVYEACRAACIHDKILTFPSGYMSKVGERGVKLSGGERQRIAIARVLLKSPQIVLLDEATSAMDSGTETKIQLALNRLMKGRTALVIAHRLSTIIEADKILVLDGGRVIEMGTHHELLQANGRYLELWTKQSAQAMTPVESEEAVE